MNAAALKGAAGRHRWAIVFGALGVGIMIHGIHAFARIPGDLIDARFNQYVLEHFWRFITFRDADFWNAAFFYPYPLTTAFSSNHLGSAPAYALFRAVGFNRDSAFQLWYLAGYAANFAAAYWVLARAGFGRAAAATAAFLFAFGLPALAQQNHAQLVWRCGVPLAAWCFWSFVRKGDPRLLFFAALATVWQLYSEIYLGIMLGMLLAALAVAACFSIPGGWRAAPGFWFGRLIGLWANRSWRERGWLGGIILLGLIAVALLVPYAQVVRHYGFVRDPAEVRLMLPQIRSYFLNDQSPLWNFVASQIDGLALRWEHQMFIGIGAVVAVVPAFFMRPPPPRHRYVRACRLGFAVLVVLTINVHNLSLYELVMRLPGLTAMRAVTRIIEVMLWPLSVLTAATLTTWLARRPQGATGADPRVLAATAMALLVAESALSRQYAVSKRFSQERVASLKSEIQAAPQPPESPAISFAATRAPGDVGVTEIDAMLAAQDLGFATFNGYSGNTPPGYAGVPTSCIDTMRRILTYIAVERPKGPDPYGAIVNRVLPIGFTDCPQDWRSQRPVATLLTKPLDQGLLASLRLFVREVKVTSDTLETVVSITTAGNAPVPASADSRFPLRLSWRFVDVNALPQREGFDTRTDIYFDVQPGKESLRPIKATLPDKTGTYRFEVSAVEENVAWLFDLGQRPATAHDLIVITQKPPP